MSIARKILMGSSGGKKSTYVDDVFSTYLYRGNETARSINNGIDNTEGGMVWLKNRDNSAFPPYVYDTVRGVNKQLRTHSTTAETSSSNTLTAFNDNGISIGTDTMINRNNDNHVAWNFRKAPGFFDVVTYTGNGTAGRTIAHSLGSIPGCIIVKRTDTTDSWQVYHRGNIQGDQNAAHYFLNLDQATPKTNNSSRWNDTEPTASVFTVGADAGVNTNGGEYVAYLFGGGESTAATARSVSFDGIDDQLNIADNTDFELGNGDFTLETWIRSTITTSSYKTAVAKWVDSGSNRSWMIRYSSQDIGTGWSFFYSTNGWDYGQSGSSSGGTVMGSDISDGQWHHVAVTRTGGKIRTFTDGILNTTVSETGTFYDGTGNVTIGGQSGNYLDGQISNVRLVKGTALYTSSFRPPTEPLTNVTNTVLLCCNNSSVTGSTVTAGTITASSSPTAITANPFDDPEGFQFGKNGDQNIIKCGSWIGNGSSSDGPTIECGFEPQWILKKGTGGNENWWIYDTMRGIVTTYNDNYIITDLTNAEGQHNVLEVTPTGFKITTNSAIANQNGYPYIYMAIRRPDGYVGKPAKVGTDVFTVVNGDTDGDATTPFFVTPHIVDFALFKGRNITHNWGTSPRLTQGYYLSANQTRAENANIHQFFGFMNGFNDGTDTSGSYTGWLWKRHAGLDVVTYSGQSGSKIVPHSLNAVPEMMWVKNRTYDDANGWTVYHKGLNGGTNPEQYRIRLQNTNAEDDNNLAWNDTAPTSTHFTLGHERMVNQDSYNYIAYLFSSVAGVSKVGYYNGTGVSGLTVTTGFTPRFLIIKNNTWSSGDWFVYDTVRGWASGNDAVLLLNSSGAQVVGSTHATDPTSTGFSVVSTDTAVNASGQKYIYYAHA